VLARDVGDLRIEYLDADIRYGAQWLSEWSRHGGLPELVRINLEEATGSWPEFIVQPKVRPIPIDDNE
jgi:hypothetical protein